METNEILCEIGRAIDRAYIQAIMKIFNNDMS